MDAKAALRSRFRAERQSLSLGFRQKASQTAAQHLLKGLAQLAPNPAQTPILGVYFAVGSELDPAPLLPLLEASGWRYALPRLGSAPRSMDFVSWRPGEPLKKNAHKIPEPVAGELIPPEKLTALLLPLVAFDALGTRLGQGGGFYDVYCTRYSGPRIGWAFACQRNTDALPREALDIPLTHLTTEGGFFSFPLAR